MNVDNICKRDENDFAHEFVLASCFDHGQGALCVDCVEKILDRNSTTIYHEIAYAKLGNETCCKCGCETTKQKLVEPFYFI